MPLIKPSAKAPSFSLRDQHGHPHALKDYAGRAVVLYFYPKDDTTGCTSEACQFRDLHPDFIHVKAAILGISPDDEASHLKFDDKHALGFTLLADKLDAKGTPKTSAAYGVWGEKSMYGRKFMGVVRTTYLISPDGTVAQRWDNVKVPGHGAEVLAAAKDLHSGNLVEIKPLKRRKPAAKAKKTKSSNGKRARTHDSNPPYSPTRSRSPKKTLAGKRR